MRSHTQLMLPALDQLDGESVVSFAVVNRSGSVTDSGELSLRAVQNRCQGQVFAILQADDAIVAQVQLPPALPARHLHAAVASQVEPMLVGDATDVVLGHGTRQANGQVCVAWASRRALHKAFQQLREFGLQVHGFLPLSVTHAAGPGTEAVGTNNHARKQLPLALPGWFLTVEHTNARGNGQRWQRAALISCAAALVWLGGLQFHAAQLNEEMQLLNDNMLKTAQKLLPGDQVVLDPLKQARQQLAALQGAAGQPAASDFIVMAVKAAQVLPFAQGQVVSLTYTNGLLTLELAQGHTPSVNDSKVQQRAVQQGLDVQRQAGSSDVWHIKMIEKAARPEQRP